VHERVRHRAPPPSSQLDADGDRVGAGFAAVARMDSSPTASSVGHAAAGHVARPRRSLRRVALAGAARGIAGGLVATVAMSAVMLGAQKAGLLGRMPPRKITDSLLGALGLRGKTSEPARRALATVNHLAFGGACGALFGLAHEVWRVRAPTTSGVRGHGTPLLAGLAFGTAIWAVSYAGWVPAFAIMPTPKTDRPGRPTSMVVAHWVFGGVLAKIVAA
jgi:hypothetical protein